MLISIAFFLALLGLALACLALRHIDRQQDEIEFLTKRLRLLEESEWQRCDGFDFLAEQAFAADMRKRIEREKAGLN